MDDAVLTTIEQRRSKTMAKKNNTPKSPFASFSVPTLIKLAQMEADKNHNGALTILASDGEFKAVFGQGAPAQAADVAAHDSLKSALVNLLVESPKFVSDEFA